MRGRRERALARLRLGALAALTLCAGAATAQTASPDTTPPKFPAAAAFEPKNHPASARQQER